MPNVALLETAMRFVEQHTLNHDQSIWLSLPRPGMYNLRNGADDLLACGTYGCLFGWAVALSGEVVRIDAGLDDTRVFLAEHPDLPLTVQDAARQLLSLDHGTATALSGPVSTRAELRRMVDAVKRGQRISAYGWGRA